MSGNQSKTGTTTVRGTQPDIIELWGSIHQTFIARDSYGYLAFSNGVLIAAFFADRQWKFNVWYGTDKVLIDQNGDVVVEDAGWAVFGQHYGLVL